MDRDSQSPNPADAPATLQGAFDPLSDEFRADPYRYYRWFRENDPVHCRPHRPSKGRNHWYLTRHTDISSVIRDERVGREPRRQMLLGKDDPIPACHQAFAETIREWLLFRDPPEHTRLRQVVSRAINSAQTKVLRSRIEAIVSDLLDELISKPQVDLVEDFAAVVPIRIITQLLGLNPGDAAEVRQCTTTVIRGIDNAIEPALLHEANSAILRLNKLAGAATRCPYSGTTDGNEILDSLLADCVPAGKLQPQELIPNVIMLLIGGNDSSTNLIANGIRLLHLHPEQKQLIRDQPELIKSTVTEILRFEPPVQMVARDALDDIPLAGKTIRKGDAISFVLASANRDPALFERPDEFLVTRKNAQQHLTFGAGIHGCPGGWLAQLEAEIALAAFCERAPSLTLLEHETTWRKLSTFRGLKRLLARFESNPPTQRTGT